MGKKSTNIRQGSELSSQSYHASAARRCAGLQELTEVCVLKATRLQPASKPPSLQLPKLLQTSLTPVWFLPFRGDQGVPDAASNKFQPGRKLDQEFT